MKNNNVLVINGKRYDAITGQLLGPSDQPTNKARSVDGLSTPKKSKKPAVTKPTDNEKVSKPSAEPKQSTHSHDIIMAKSVHSVSTTKPLMRRGLKKPTKASDSYKQPETSVATHRTPDGDIHAHHDSARAERADKIPRSNHVRHFSKHHSAAPRSIGSTSSPVTTYPARMMDAVSTQTDKLQNIIDRGMQKATSHDQQSPINQKRKAKSKRSKLRTFNILVSVAAILLILGFVIDKSMPDIDIHIASSKSGVHAEIPNYIPAGYKFEGPVKYGQGIVTVIFTSGTKSFRVIQQDSSWDSAGLRDSFVTTVDPHYTVVEAGGRIVYLYNQADATWVNAGVWYQITDNANFSTATLLRIVTSL